jgi:hypothetical protein
MLLGMMILGLSMAFLPACGDSEPELGPDDAIKEMEKAKDNADEGKDAAKDKMKEGADALDKAADDM